MRTPDRPTPALSFAAESSAYDRARPSYPAEAVAWLIGASPRSVVEVGAGTGKFTDRLVEAGHDVFATDPLEEMLSHLRLRHPDLRTAAAPAEAIPVATRSVDVVVAAQSFHWFDPETALREISRVLRPEGRLSVAVNVRDGRIPWVRRLGKILGDPGHTVDPSEAIVASRRFGYVEETSFRHWTPMRRDDLRDLARSRSNVALMDPRAQDRLLAQVDELYAEYDRGPAGLLLPYVTHCYRATVKPRGRIDEPEHSADLTAAAQAALAMTLSRQEAEAAEEAATLIDFR